MFVSADAAINYKINDRCAVADEITLPSDAEHFQKYLANGLRL